MPYESNEALPDQVRDNASSACQTVFRRAFNSIEEDNPGLSEAELFQRAWGAVQNACSRESDDDEYTTDNGSQGEASMTDTDLDTASQSGFAALVGSTDDDPFTVHGVAIGEGDITQGASGTRTYWPQQTLKAAADGLAGKKIVDDSEHGDLEASQPPVSAILGEVTEATYKDGVGVVFEGEIDNSDVASLIENGRVDVSPALFRGLGEYDDARDAKPATEILKWRDLSVVAEGAAPSNSIQPGAAALQAEALQAVFDDAVDNTTTTDTADDDGDRESQSDESAESDTDTNENLNEATLCLRQTQKKNRMKRKRRTSTFRMRR